MSGRKWSHDTLLRDLGSGGYVGVHSKHPGEEGRDGVLVEPSKVGPFKVSPHFARLGRTETTSPARRGGRARYFSVWTRNRVYMTAVKIEPERQVEAGVAVRIERGGIEVRL